MNIFQRAHAGLNLSPEERAFLKVVQGFAIVALVAAAGTLATVVSNGATFHDAVLAVAVSAGVATLLAVAKYFSANGQPALGAAIGTIAGDLNARYGVPAAKVEPAVPAA